MSNISPSHSHEADMGFTRRELLRGLPNAVVPYQIVDPEADVVIIRLDDCEVRLSTGPDGVRAIASMRVPRLAVKLEFFGFDQVRYDAFMKQFKKSLHKGGG